MERSRMRVSRRGRSKRRGLAGRSTGDLALRARQDGRWLSRWSRCCTNTGRAYGSRVARPVLHLSSSLHSAERWLLRHTQTQPERGLPARGDWGWVSRMKRCCPGKGRDGGETGRKASVRSPQTLPCVCYQAKAVHLLQESPAALVGGDWKPCPVKAG